MTRVEKYQKYREEIAKSQKLGKSVQDTDEKVKEFTKEINKLNPSILSSAKNNTLAFEKGIIDIDVSNKEVPLEVTKMFDTLDQAAVSNQSDQINNFFHNKINHTILTSDKKIDPNWLATNQQYGKMESLNNSLNTNIIEETVFVKDLTDKYNNMAQENKMPTVKPIEQVKPSSKKLTLSKTTLAIVIATIAILVGLVVLVIIKGVR